jgi:hypothetical protein
VTLEAQLRQAMLAYAPLQAAIAQRLYEVQIPQGALLSAPTAPLVAFQRITTTREYSQNFGATQARFGWARFQFTVFCGGANGGETTGIVAGLIIDSLQSFNLSVPAASPNVVTSAPNFVVNQRMEVEPQTTNQPIFKTILDLRIGFQDLN